MRFDGPLELDHTLGCGQAFRWRTEGGWHRGTVGEVALKVRRVGEGLEYFSSPAVEPCFVSSYFRLDDDLDAILCEIDRHRHMSEAIRRYRGLRLLRQEPWECLVSYVASIVSNIPKISRCIENLSEKYGKRLELNGWVTYSFPTPQALARAGTRGLMDCELGFRARYLSALAKEVAGGRIDLQALRKAPYGDARRALMELRGVGEKVADCVSLFSLDKLEAFPVDRWVQRVASRLFLDNRPVPVKKVREWGMRQFGRYAGYAQQYLFHYIRHLSPSSLPQ